MMLAIERRNLILSKLRKENRVMVGSLSKEFKVTEETIRRDLEKLEKDGFARKTYGGAILKESLYVDLPYTVRKKANVVNKQEIAELVKTMVQDGDHIMLDASSTAVYIASRLKDRKNLTLITNSVEILYELSDVNGWKILSTGGAMKEGFLSLSGPQAEKMISSFHVDKAIVSCKGLAMDFGFTDANETEAQMKQAMLKSAGTKILAMDSTKFDKISFAKIGDLSELDVLVTDLEPDQEWKKLLEDYHIESVYKNNRKES